MYKFTKTKPNDKNALAIKFRAPDEKQSLWILDELEKDFKKYEKEIDFYEFFKMYKFALVKIINERESKKLFKKFKKHQEKK